MFLILIELEGVRDYHGILPYNLQWGSVGARRNADHYISRWRRKLEELPFIRFAGVAHST
jgi:hypothetical protein